MCGDVLVQVAICRLSNQGVPQLDSNTGKMKVVEKVLAGVERVFPFWLAKLWGSCVESCEIIQI